MLEGISNYSHNNKQQQMYRANKIIDYILKNVLFFDCMSAILCVLLPVYTVLFKHRTFHGQLLCGQETYTKFLVQLFPRSSTHRNLLP